MSEIVRYKTLKEDFAVFKAGWNVCHTTAIKSWQSGRWLASPAAAALHHHRRRPFKGVSLKKISLVFFSPNLHFFLRERETLRVNTEKSDNNWAAAGWTGS